MQQDFNFNEHIQCWKNSMKSTARGKLGAVEPALRARGPEFDSHRKAKYGGVSVYNLSARKFLGLTSLHGKL